MWYGPDRQGTGYANSGDPSFYATIDLGNSCDIHYIRFKNGVSNEYHVGTMRVSVSTYTLFPGSPTEFSLNTAQLNIDEDLAIGQTGRYIKLHFAEYGAYSAGVRRVLIFGVC